MSITQSQYVATLRGLTSLFDQGYKQASPFYPTVCSTRPSHGKDEQYGLAGAMPGVREWMGERQFKELSAAEWTLANKLWELSILLRKTDWEDDRVGMYRDLTTELGAEMAYHPDELRLQVQVAGEASECWDGQYFYDSDHVWRKSGTQSNIYVASGTVDPNKPTTAEFRAAVEGAVDRLLGFKRDNGKPWIRPVIGKLDNLIVEVPISMRTASHQAFGQLLKLESGAATTNVVVDSFTPVVTPQLGTNGGLGGNDAHCYLHYVGSTFKPFVFQPRWKNYKTSIADWDNDKVKDMSFMGTNRLNLGYGMWMFSIKIKFTA